MVLSAKENKVRGVDAKEVREGWSFSEGGQGTFESGGGERVRGAEGTGSAKALR